MMGDCMCRLPESDDSDYRVHIHSHVVSQGIARNWDNAR